MKIAVYKFGRELNGGHTTVCVDLKKYCDKEGIETHFYSYAPGKKKRKTFVNEDANFAFDEFCINSIQDSEKITDELNNFDLIILLEPPTKAASKDDALKFMSIYENAKPLKWYQYHDAQMKQTSRNRGLLEAIAYSDIVSTHHVDSPVAKIARKCGKHVTQIKLFKDFEMFEKFYENTNRRREVMYIGRFEKWKGPTYMLDIAEKLNDANIIPSMIGIDRSPGSYHCLLSNELVQNGTIIVEGRYNFNYGFERLKNTTFAFVPTNLPNKDYGDRMEYCQLESIACGAIPIMHINQGENCHLNTGKSWASIPYFAVWYDDKNPQKAVDEIINIMNNESLKSKYKGTALRYMKQELDFSKYGEYLLNNLKMTKTRCSISDVLVSYGWTSEQISTYHEANSNYFIKCDLELLEAKNIRVITGKRGATTLYDKIRIMEEK